MTPKELVLYQIEYYDLQQNRWMRSGWKMTAADAKAIYANRQYKILRNTREVLRIDGSLPLTGAPGRPNPA